MTSLSEGRKGQLEHKQVQLQMNETIGRDDCPRVVSKLRVSERYSRVVQVRIKSGWERGRTQIALRAPESIGS